MRPPEKQGMPGRDASVHPHEDQGMPGRHASQKGLIHVTLVGHTPKKMYIRLVRGGRSQRGSKSLCVNVYGPWLLHLLLGLGDLGRRRGHKILE